MTALTDVALPTPEYVLMLGHCPFGPKVELDGECLSIFGFSDKLHYDKFNVKSSQALTPYPLVKGYLRNHTSASDNRLKLVIVNACGPDEPVLYATTMDSVLEAREAPSPHLVAAYRLAFDPSTRAYRIESLTD